MIAVVDYGLGNVQAVTNIYKKLGISCSIVREPEALRSAEKIILPGVGSFDQAIKRLEISGFRKMLDAVISTQRLPVLGICVGMQMLGCSSEEGILTGLGWIDAVVKRFNFSSAEYSQCVPHMGWNSIKQVQENPLLKQLDVNSNFYFLHSYYMECQNSNDIIAMTEYGGEFASAVNSKNVYGVQFHPEKSHGFGIQLLKNFAEL
jgi:glutamine amidotransferase